MLELDEKEKLIQVFRKHTFHIWMKFSGLALIALMPIVAYAFVKSFITADLSSQSMYLLFFVYLVFLAVLWNIGFVFWTDYYLDMWILTDRRLIDVEQKGLFSREVSSLRLDRIQDIKVEVSGMVQTFVGMGSVHVQTAGNENEFLIHDARHPEKIKELILSAHNEEMEKVKTVRVEN